MIGHSVQGRAIRAYRVGDPTSANRVVVMATMHGDEPRTRLDPGRLRDGRPVRGIDLWVVPVVQPRRAGPGTRRNAHGVDLNRNYPYLWADLDGNYESGPRAASEPETRAMMAFFDEVRPRRVVSFHQPLTASTSPATSPGPFARRLARVLHLPGKPLDLRRCLPRHVDPVVHRAACRGRRHRGVRPAPRPAPHGGHRPAPGAAGAGRLALRRLRAALGAALAALEDRLLLGHERVDGVAVVGGAAGERHHLGLEGQRGRRSRGRRCTPPSGGSRRATPSARRPAAGAASATSSARSSAGHDRGGQPELERLVGLDGAREVEQLERLGPADQPRQRPRRAGVAGERDAGEGQVEARGVGQRPGSRRRTPGSRRRPAATPLTAATTGLGIVASAVTIGL